MTNAQQHFLNSIGSPEIYLNRQFPNRLSFLEMKELILERLTTYNKKHKGKRYHYKYSIEDLQTN